MLGKYLWRGNGLSGVLRQRQAGPAWSGVNFSRALLYETRLVRADAGRADRVGDGIETQDSRQGAIEIFYVRDNGIGIDPRYHERVFGLFDQLDPKADGTGIGLALARRIIEVHGERIWTESEGPGRGSTFCFTIPARAAS